MLRKTIFLVVAAVLAIGLAKGSLYIKQKQTTEQPLARVYDQYLYRSDVAQYLTTVPKAAEKEAEIEAQYIQNWVAKQLLIAAAEAYNKHNKVELERKVLDYRYELLVHDFMEQQVQAQLDKEISDEEISHYYQTHQEAFTLRSSFFKGKFIVLPRAAPQKAKLLRLLMSKTVRQQEALKKYCLQHAKNYVLDDEAGWLPWDELIRNTPFNKRRDKNNLLEKGKLLQTRNKAYRYYFRIDECRKVGDISPLELVKDQIAAMILYKRKAVLATKIKQDLLEKAKNNNKCIIYEQE